MRRRERERESQGGWLLLISTIFGLVYGLRPKIWHRQVLLCIRCIFSVRSKILADKKTCPECMMSRRERNETCCICLSFPDDKSAIIVRNPLEEDQDPRGSFGLGWQDEGGIHWVVIHSFNVLCVLDDCGIGTIPQVDSTDHHDSPVRPSIPSTIR